MLRTVVHQDVGKLWSQALTGSKRESMAAASCPIIRKIRPPLVFINLEPPQGEGKALALKETFWWPSQESAVTVQVSTPCYVECH